MFNKKGVRINLVVRVKSAIYGMFGPGFAEFPFYKNTRFECLSVCLAEVEIGILENPNGLFAY